jgi:1-acyl-sn-glycerol-3-phosphate acyltransferase
MNWLYRFCHFGSWLTGRLLYRNRVFGIDRLPTGSALIAPNHASHLDPPLVASALPMEIHFLARESLFRIPLVGRLIRKLNTHPVGGSGGGDIASLRMVMQLLKEGKKVMIFPEGTRTYDGELGECAPGVGMIAMRTGCAVVPVYVHGTYEAWSRHRKFPKLFGRTACVIGEPFTAALFDHLGKKEAQRAIAEEVMRRIAELKSWYENAILLKNKQ